MFRKSIYLMIHVMVPWSIDGWMLGYSGCSVGTVGVWWKRSLANASTVVGKSPQVSNWLWKNCWWTSWAFEIFSISVAEYPSVPCVEAGAGHLTHPPMPKEALRPLTRPRPLRQAISLEVWSTQPIPIWWKQVEKKNNVCQVILCDPLWDG